VTGKGGARGEGVEELDGVAKGVLVLVFDHICAEEGLVVSRRHSTDDGVDGIEDYDLCGEKGATCEPFVVGIVIWDTFEDTVAEGAYGIERIERIERMEGGRK